MLFTHVIIKVRIPHFKSNLFIFKCSEFSMACIPKKRGALYLIFRFDFYGPPYAGIIMYCSWDASVRDFLVPASGGEDDKPKVPV